MAISENMIIKERRRILKGGTRNFIRPFYPGRQIVSGRERGLRIKCATSSSPRLIYASGLLIRKDKFFIAS